ncbi:MAG TPA: hypothetical protein VGW75_04330 [Solirubrobacteraceae bacterium]|jgi:hypothetical protein|nr:hypothetical protein [Solirubrobacteraceae bacterium]
MPRALLRVLTLAALLAAVPASVAGASAFAPPAGEVLHGVAGGYSVDSYARETGRRPEVFQLFGEWGNVDWAFRRADASGARMMLHLSTARGPGTPERITPAQIAEGLGDAFVLRLGERIAERGEPVYLRLMAEMNGPWNQYCAFDAGGRARPGHSTRSFRAAWRRVALMLRGGDRAAVNARLRALRLPPVQAGSGPLAQAPVALMWVPHNAVALNVRANRPRAYWPGARYVDWVGTDFYGRSPNWGALERIYTEFPGKPFVFGEWALWGRDDPAFVRRVFAFARTHRRVRMLVYNQGVRADGPFRLKRYPRARRALRAALSR